MDQIRAMGYMKPASGERNIIPEGYTQRAEEKEEVDHMEGTSAGPSTSGPRKRAAEEEEEEQMVPEKRGTASDQSLEAEENEVELEAHEPQQEDPAYVAAEALAAVSPNEGERRDGDNRLIVLKLWTPANKIKEIIELGGCPIREDVRELETPIPPIYIQENDDYERQPSPNGKEDYKHWTPKEFAEWVKQVMGTSKGEEMAQQIIAKGLTAAELLKQFCTSSERMAQVFNLDLREKLRMQAAAIPHRNHHMKLAYEKKMEKYQRDKSIYYDFNGPKSSL